MWSGRGFVPVGTIDQPFSGTFDGQGNTISGLRIDRILTNNVGLFGLARNVSIANVSLTDVFIKGYEATGSLVGYLQSSHGQSTVSAVNASGQVQGRSSFAGGLVGRSLADIGGVNQISEVKADVRVSGSQFTGGLVGINHGFGGAALVLRSQASGNINGGEFVGGLVGANVAANGPASLTDVAAYGSVLGTYGVGGLAGAHYAQSSSATIHRSYASGSVTLVGFSAERGGIVGYAANSELSSSFWNVETSGQSNAIGNNAAAAGAQGLTTAQIQDTEGFMALAGAQGWDFENVWAPSSAGYDPELYALSRVARVDFGSFTRQYGEPDPNLALATIFGGPRAYVFGPAGDSLAISGAPTTAASAYSPVGSYAVSGPAAAQSAQGRDYRLVSTGRMNVTPRWLQLDFSRQYDGTANADAASAWAWNVLDGDVVSLTGTGTLGGSQANNWYELVDRGTIAVGNGNYMLAPEQGWHGGYIAQRSVQLVGTRAYDGTANVAAADLSVANLVAGDTLTLTGSSTVSGAGVGTYGFNAAAFTIDNANYYIQGNATGSLTINPAMLTVTAQGQLKAYGDADQTLAYHASGFRGSDTEASVMSGSLVRDAGENVGDYRIRIGSLAAGANYAIDFSGADLSIGRATLEVTADANGKTYGDADLELSYVASGFRFADDASIISGAAMRDAGENVGSYAIWQGSLAAGGNYAIYFRPAEFTIDPATLSVAADPATKTEGAADPALSWRASGFRLGDSAAATLTGQVERAAGETAGTYAIGRGTLAAGSNYLMVFTGAGFIIVPRAVQTPAVVTTVPGQPASPAAGAIERNAPATVTPPTAGAFGATQECRTGGVLGPQCADVPHPDTLSMLN